MEHRIGEFIKHWACGILVTGEIISIGNDGVKTKHVPVIWGNDKFTETFITFKMVAKLN